MDNFGRLLNEALGNDGFHSAAIAPYKRKTEVISSAIMKLCSAGMTDEEMRLVTMFPHYSNGIDTKKLHGWRVIVDLMGK